MRKALALTFLLLLICAGFVLRKRLRVREEAHMPDWLAGAAERQYDGYLVTMPAEAEGARLAVEDDVTLGTVPDPDAEDPREEEPGFAAEPRSKFGPMPLQTFVPLSAAYMAAMAAEQEEEEEKNWILPPILTDAERGEQEDDDADADSDEEAGSEENPALARIRGEEPEETDSASSKRGWLEQAREEQERRRQRAERKRQETAERKLLPGSPGTTGPVVAGEAGDRADEARVGSSLRRHRPVVVSSTIRGNALGQESVLPAGQSGPSGLSGIDGNAGSESRRGALPGLPGFAPAGSQPSLSGFGLGGTSRKGGASSGASSSAGAPRRAGLGQGIGGGNPSIGPPAAQVPAPSVTERKRKVFTFPGASR